jgi:hypothetical protein
MAAYVISELEVLDATVRLRLNLSRNMAGTIWPATAR